MLLQLPAPPELTNTAIIQPDSPSSSDSNFMFLFILLYLLTMQIEYKIFSSVGSKQSLSTFLFLFQFLDVLVQCFTVHPQGLNH